MRRFSGVAVKHTPGPWTIDTDGEKLFIMAGPVSVAMTGHDENAALIAAAPELFDALRAFVAMAYGEGSVDLITLRKAGAAALKKAGA